MVEGQLIHRQAETETGSRSQQQGQPAIALGGVEGEGPFPQGQRGRREHKIGAGIAAPQATGGQAFRRHAKPTQGIAQAATDDFHLALNAPVVANTAHRRARDQRVTGHQHAQIGDFQAPVPDGQSAADIAQGTAAHHQRRRGDLQAAQAPAGRHRDGRHQMGQILPPVDRRRRHMRDHRVEIEAIDRQLAAPIAAGPAGPNKGAGGPQTIGGKRRILKR